MQAYPDAELAERACQLGETGPERLPAPETRRVTAIHAVGAGILGYHQNFANPRVDQMLRLFHDLVDRPADEVAAHRRNDAKAAAMIATLGNFQIGVVARSQPHSLLRYQVDERVVRRRQVVVHSSHDCVAGVRAGYRQQRRVALLDHFGARSEAAGDDHAAVAL